MLDYRIKCGQLFQQNAIDKAKGIIAKPMPKEWFDRHSAMQIEDDNTRDLYLSILADKKPYFMKYIYPDLMRQYNTYIRNTSKKAMREFGITVDELLAKPKDGLSEAEQNFLHYYEVCMPVGTGDCVINRICRRIEDKFDGYIGRYNAGTEFDYCVMKSGTDYSRTQYQAISKLADDYNRRLRDYTVFCTRERVDVDEAYMNLQMMKVEFRNACDAACSNAAALCDILLDISYQRSSTKQFAWTMCSNEIVQNLLDKHDGWINFPTMSPDGEIHFGGNRFTPCRIQIGAAE